MLDTPLFNALREKVQSDYQQTKFTKFYRSEIVKDEWVESVSQKRGVALVFFVPDKIWKFQYNSKGEQLFHMGDERTFGIYSGLYYRTNNIYNEVIMS